MVTIVNKTINGTVYYYLRHSYRERGKVKFIDRSLGKDKSELRYNTLKKHKEEFVREVFTQLWKDNIEDIKKKYNSKVNRLTQVYKDNYFRDFGVKFTYNTNKIEGSKLNLQETGRILENSEIQISKPIKDINEVQLHWECFQDMLTTNRNLNIDLVMDWHSTLFSLSSYMKDEAGKYRTANVSVSGSEQVFPEPHLLLDLIKDLFNWYDQKKELIHPVLLSCLMHLRFVSIHPFADGNGRMTRLIMNYILHKNDYLMFDIPAKVRVSYFKSIERSYLNQDEMIFVGWFCRNYIKHAKF